MSNISAILEGLNQSRIESLNEAKFDDENKKHMHLNDSAIEEGIYDYDDYTIDYGIQFPIDGIAKAFDRFKEDGVAKFGKWAIKTDKYNSHLDWILSYKDTDLVNSSNGKINNIGLKVRDLEKLYNKVLKDKFQGSKVTNWEPHLLDMPIPDDPNYNKKRIAREKRDEDDNYDRTHKEGRYANESSVDESKRRENFVEMDLGKDEILPFIYRCMEFGDEDEDTRVFYYRGEHLMINKGNSNPALKRLEQDVKKIKTSQDLYDVKTRLEMVTM